jgi:hypothetical protein
VWSDETIAERQIEKIEASPRNIDASPQLLGAEPPLIDITKRPDTTPKEIIQIKQNFADYVKSHNLRNERDYPDAIDLYIDMLWHNLHKIEVIVIAIKHLKAKIDEI